MKLRLAQALQPEIVADMSEQEIVKMVALRYAHEAWSDVDENCALRTVIPHVEWEVRLPVTYDQATMTVKKTGRGYEVTNVDWYFGIA
jgi:hypothetical protein